jgi:hypothetical protein
MCKPVVFRRDAASGSRKVNDPLLIGASPNARMARKCVAGRWLFLAVVADRTAFIVQLFRRIM